MCHPYLLKKREVDDVSGKVRLAGVVDRRFGNAVKLAPVLSTALIEPKQAGGDEEDR